MFSLQGRVNSLNKYKDMEVQKNAINYLLKAKKQIVFIENRGLHKVNKMSKEGFQKSSS